MFIAILESVSKQIEQAGMKAWAEKASSSYEWQLQIDDGLARQIKYLLSFANKAAEELTKIGIPSVEPLLAVLNDKSKDGRQYAAKVLGQIGDDRAVEPLSDALCREVEVRIRRGYGGGTIDLRNYQSIVDILNALIQIGEPAVEPLTAMLLRKREIRSEDRFERYRREDVMCQAAAEALGKIGAPSSVEPLVVALKDSNEGVRQAAAEALVKISAPAVEPLIVALKDSNEGLRKAAAEVLVKIGAPAVELLITALKDGNEGVRQAAAEALDKIGWRPGQDESGVAYWIAKHAWSKCVEIGAPAVEPLIASLNDSNGVMRQAAAVALGKLGDARAVEPLFAALKDSSKLVNRAAAEALGQIGDTRAAEPLNAALKDSDETVRRAAAEALGQIGDARAAEPLNAALKDSNSHVRKAAAGALDKIGWRPGQDESGAVYWVVKREWDKCIEIGTPAVAPLIAALKDSDGDVREAAAGALDKIGWRPGQDESGAVYWVVKQKWDKCIEIGAPAVEPLIAALKDSDLWMRQGAAEALGKLGDARAVEPLVATLQDSSKDMRRAAAQSLVNIYGIGQLDQVQKSLILAQRKQIILGDNRHYDNRMSYYEQECSKSGHHDYHEDSHTDTSIGVDFPL
jgi:HEAT repeat protein